MQDETAKEILKKLEEIERSVSKIRTDADRTNFLLEEILKKVGKMNSPAEQNSPK